MAPDACQCKIKMCLRGILIILIVKEMVRLKEEKKNEPSIFHSKCVKSFSTFCKDMLENKMQIYKYIVNDYIVYKAAADCGV